MDQDQTPAPPAQTKLDVPMPDNPPKYVPQFSAATEMILKRINSGASVSNLAAISSSGPTVAYTGGSAKYEDMRRSVLMGMKTSMNMEMPATPISQKTKVQRAAKAKGSPSTPGATPSSASGSASGKGKGKGKGRGRAGGKRKRAQDEESLSEEEESEGEMSQLGGDSEDDDGGSVTSLPKITQSGRQVNKPTSYVPSSYEAPPKKRVAQAKRTQEQALCKRCGRGNSPEKNMIVFCDGCNLCWHQNCHDPVITEETVKDEVAPWFCSDCSRKRNVKTPASEQRGVSWQGRSSEEQSKSAQSRSNAQSSPSNQQSAASSAGLFARSESNPRASMNFIRKIPAGQPATPPLPQAAIYQPPSTHLTNQNQNSQTNGDSRESTPASPAYPKPGNGLMAKLGPDEDDTEWLVDTDGDFEAFSHTVYDDHGIPNQTGGITVEENGDDLLHVSIGVEPGDGSGGSGGGEHESMDYSTDFGADLGVNGGGGDDEHGHGHEL